MADFTTLWQDTEESKHPDQLKRFVYQKQEQVRADSLPHVIKALPPQQTMNGRSSPHQAGDLTCCDILIRAPLYELTGHFMFFQPNAPLRGVHRHISPVAIFCLSGKGWEVNDDERYEFETYDLLVVPPFSIHQHGGDREIGGSLYASQARMIHALALLQREQIQFCENPVFPAGTEPLHNEEGKLIGYRIKKGVLGITKDIDVYLGPEPNTEAVFKSRREAASKEVDVRNTYDRYLRLLYDEVTFLKTVTHVIRYEEQPWEWTRQGRLKWLTHPDISCSDQQVWIYMQEIPPGSRSGKHRHMAEEFILVINGRGYDVHDGERWNWEKGNLIAIPCMEEHQHFNTDRENPAFFFSSMPSMCTHIGLGGFEQLEDAPEFPEV